MSEYVYASGINFAAVTPSDTATVKCVALYVGTGGNIALAPQTGSAVVFKNVPSGTFLPMMLRDGRVMATNTTAADIVAVNW